MSSYKMEYWSVALDGVVFRFPQHTKTIKRFYEGSPSFREICADHQEMVIWLDKHCRSEEDRSINCEYAEDVLKELEAELIDCMEEKNTLVNDEMEKSGK